MNLQVIRWLIANREVLTNCIEIVQGFDMESPLIERWDVVDKVARQIIPLLSSDDVLELHSHTMFGDDEYSAMSCGVELQAMGVDWQLVINALVPIIVAILQSLMPADDEE